MQKREAAVIFLFIDSLSDFGTYKCKANNSFPNITKYSNGFNFTLAGMNEKRLLLLTNWDHKKIQNVATKQVFSQILCSCNVMFKI